MRPQPHPHPPAATDPTDLFASPLLKAVAAFRIPLGHSLAIPAALPPIPAPWPIPTPSPAPPRPNPTTRRRKVAPPPPPDALGCGPWYTLVEDKPPTRPRLTPKAPDRHTQDESQPDDPRQNNNRSHNPCSYDDCCSHRNRTFPDDVPWSSCHGSPLPTEQLPGPTPDASCAEAEGCCDCCCEFKRPGRRSRSARRLARLVRALTRLLRRWPEQTRPRWRLSQLRARRARRRRRAQLRWLRRFYAFMRSRTRTSVSPNPTDEEESSPPSAQEGSVGTPPGRPPTAEESEATAAGLGLPEYVPVLADLSYDISRLSNDEIGSCNDQDNITFCALSDDLGWSCSGESGMGWVGPARRSGGVAKRVGPPRNPEGLGEAEGVGGVSSTGSGRTCDSAVRESFGSHPSGCGGRGVDFWGDDQAGIPQALSEVPHALSQEGGVDPGRGEGGEPAGCVDMGVDGSGGGGGAAGVGQVDGGEAGGDGEAGGGVPSAGPAGAEEGGQADGGTVGRPSWAQGEGVRRGGVTEGCPRWGGTSGVFEVRTAEGASSSIPPEVPVSSPQRRKLVGDSRPADGHRESAVPGEVDSEPIAMTQGRQGTGAKSVVPSREKRVPGKDGAGGRREFLPRFPRRNRHPFLVPCSRWFACLAPLEVVNGLGRPVDGPAADVCGFSQKSEDQWISFRHDLNKRKSVGTIPSYYSYCDQHPWICGWVGLSENFRWCEGQRWTGTVGSGDGTGGVRIRDPPLV
jgi:hypothetical protein